MKKLKHYYRRAQKEGWAMAQLNFSTAEQLKGICQAAVSVNSPLLVGTSEGDGGFLGFQQAASLVAAWRKTTGLPIFLNLDHGKSFGAVREAVEAGYDAVHIDASELSFAKNVELTRKVVGFAGRRGILVEGELGRLQGSSRVHTESTIVLDPRGFTDPKDAKEFVKRTGVDALAVTFGNVHGVFEKMPPLDMERLQKIRKRVQSFLVLHGGSGISKKDVLRAVKLGIVKINVSTELRAAYTGALREELAKDERAVTPYRYLPSAVKEVEKTARAKLQFFGSANKA